MNAPSRFEAAPDGKAARFLALHRPGDPLLMPNPWDAGSAWILAAIGFQALATTSGGHAGSLGRPDGSVTRDEALAHAAELAAAVDVPVSADLEHCFAAEPEGVAATVRAAIDAGLAGCSVEDWDPAAGAVYESGLAAARVEAAAEAARTHGAGLVLTARCENYLHDRPDLDDTLRRLGAYRDAGADVLYAPLLPGLDEIRAVVAALDRPVNVLVGAGSPSVADLAGVGVARISVGSAFAKVAWGALARAGEELRDLGTYGWAEPAGEGGRVAGRAFRSS